MNVENYPFKPYRGMLKWDLQINILNGEMSYYLKVKSSMWIEQYLLDNIKIN